MIWFVVDGGTARRYCRECGDPLPATILVEGGVGGGAMLDK
ncbi:hypothetical protein [Streptomyces sp. OE57]